MIKLKIFDWFERLSYHVIGPLIRRSAVGINQYGINLQGDLASDDRLVPSLRCRSHQGKYPTLAKASFVAPNSVIIGNVSVGEQSSIWYASNIRGDIGSISIGKNTVIQDLVTLMPRIGAKSDIKIGDNVLIAPNSVIEGCTIENNAFIGMGASVRQNAKVSSQGIVAAGAVIEEDKNVPSHQIWAGNPANYLRDVTPEEEQVIYEHQYELQQLAKIHAEETEKSFRQILDDEEEIEADDFAEEEEAILNKLKEMGFPVENEDEEFIEQRVYLREQPIETEEYFFKKNYDPYEQDLFHFPDYFKKYGQNYEKQEQMKKYFDDHPIEDADTTSTTERQAPKNEDPWTKKF